MPSGPKKRRKAAKKKQIKESSNSNSSSPTNSHHGENDGGELISPAAQDQLNHQARFTDREVEKKNETSLYQNESLMIPTTEKAVKPEEGYTELNKGSKKLSKSDNSSSSSIDSNVDNESRVFPEKIVHEVKDSGVETFSVLNEIKPADSEVKDGTQIEKLVPKSSFSKQMVVVNGSALKDNCSTSSDVRLSESVMVENGAAKLASPEENASIEARDDDDKQPLVASAPRAAEKTSWKGCCGILELFSSSDRN